MRLKIYVILLFAFTFSVFGQVKRIDITLSKNDFDNLFIRRLDSKKYINASMNIDGNTYKNTQIRFKGNTSLLYSKKPLKLKFEKNSQLPSFFKNIRNVDCNAMFTDKSFMREKLVWDIYRMLNGFGPEELGYADVFINGVDYGLVILIQHVSDNFFKYNNREEGYLYEAKFNDIPGDLSVVSDDVLKNSYENETEKNENDYSPLKELINRINNAGESDFANVVNELFDMNTVYNWLVLNSVTMDADTYAKNYFLYKDPSKSLHQWSIIPWDYDLSFGRDSDKRLEYPFAMLNDIFSYNYDPFEGTKNVLKDRINKDLQLRSEFLKRLNEVLQNIFTEEKMYPMIDGNFADIDEYVKRESVKWGSYFDFTEQTEALKYFVTVRRNFLLATLFGQGSSENDEATLSITTTGIPYKFVDHDGKMVGTMTFKSISGLEKVRLHALPSDIPPGMNPDNCIKRYVEVIPYPPGAQFEAELVWEFINDPDLTEVGPGVLNSHALESYNYKNGSWNFLSSTVNSNGNFVTISGINESNCGEGRYFALKLPDNFRQNWVKQNFNIWQTINDMSTPDENNIYAAGDDGLILVSGDGGSSWKQNFIGIHVQIRTISPLNSSTIYAAGMFGVVAKTINGGSMWSYVSTPAPNNINCIKFISEQKGYGVTDRGIFIQTINGGASWSSNQLSSTKDLYALEITGNGSIIAGGEKGSLYRSIDDGKTWISLNSPTDKRINVLSKNGENEIYGACNDGVIIRSTDNGESWSEITLNAGTDLCALLTGNNIFIAAGSSGNIFRSSNGMDWSKDDNQYTNDLRSITRSSGSGVLIGGSSGIILQSR